MTVARADLATRSNTDWVTEFTFMQTPGGVAPWANAQAWQADVSYDPTYPTPIVVDPIVGDLWAASASEAWVSPDNWADDLANWTLIARAGAYTGGPFDLTGFDVFFTLVKPDPLDLTGATVLWPRQHIFQASTMNGLMLVKDAPNGIVSLAVPRNIHEAAGVLPGLYAHDIVAVSFDGVITKPLLFGSFKIVRGAWL